MSKYSFDRMQPDEFESMAQALLEGVYRVDGNLIQFGDGPDGGREATWTQSPNHETYTRPANEESDVPKEWVFQVKYHDVGQRGWTSARDAVVADFGKELDKIVNKYSVPCHAYVMITNVPFTGARNVGTRDRIIEVATQWRTQVPEIYAWDAADLSRMLDANESVRTAYLDTILPGDLLRALFKGATFREDRKNSAFKAYLQFVSERESSARAEEAGDEPGLALDKVFIDLTLKPLESAHESVQQIHANWPEGAQRSEDSLLPSDFSNAPASFALLLANHPAVLLLGGPGLGKSTLTQFLALYHASRMVDSKLSLDLAKRLKLPSGLQPEYLDSYCQQRFPFRIELRRYAQWINEQKKHEQSGELARYVAESLINPNVASNLEMDDVFALTASDPVLLILDGLDEVPHAETRQEILGHLRVFMRRSKAENGDIQLLFSSRPKGYSGEFDEFQPLTWELNELDSSDFNDYCNRWLDQRVRDAQERREAFDRINRGMKSDAVQRLAKTLLQATVMLAIVRRKSEIPHERHALYAKYVDVIFDREKEKSPVVREHVNELRRLHERVGYELHRKTEQTGAEALDRDSFRGYILDVLQDYSGEDLGERRIRQVADEIVNAATDRLCMLVGKGKDQTEVDFVVQSFREYFAATYLINHPEADPERVFSALVARGGFWANVLQFYVAQANVNQQMRWVLSAESRSDEEPSIDATLNRVRTRRALLSILPEFALQRKTDFDRALRAIFASDTRWTWLNDQSAIEILRIVRSGVSRKLLQESFEPFSTDDSAALEAELWLLEQLIPDGTDEYERLHKIIQSFVEEDVSRTVAMNVCFASGMAVDLSSCDMPALRFAAGHGDSRIAPALAEVQTTEKLCELVLAGFVWGEKNDGFPSSSYPLTRTVDRMQMEIISQQVSLMIRPFLSRDVNYFDELRCIDEILDGNSVYVKYLEALLIAARDPTCVETDVYARNAFNELPTDVSWQWEPDSFLGPSPTSFRSPDRCKEFWDLVSQVQFQNKEWTLANCNPDVQWPLFFFHPNHWPVLIEEQIVSADAVGALQGSPIGKLFGIAESPLNVFLGWGISPSREPALPLLGLVRAAIAVAEVSGADGITKGSGLDGLLHGRDVGRPSVEAVEELLSMAIGLSPFPPIWTSAILRLALAVPHVDVNLLIDFWQKNEVKMPYLIDFPRDENLGGVAALLKKLLHERSKTAFRLALAVVGCAGAPDSVEQRLRDRIASEMPDDVYGLRLCMNALESMRPSIDEFQIWQRQEWRTLMSDHSWYVHRLRERVLESPDKHLKTMSRELIYEMKPFITERSRFPTEVAKAALESALRLQHSQIPPLSDADWKCT